jgi:hypothetical protein
MIQTSYFARIKNHPHIASGELRAVSIALSVPPGWPEDAVCFALRPWPFMVHQYKDGSLTEFGYEQRYRECVLAKVPAQFVLDHYDNCVLCCWEAPDKWCHRRVVQKWIAEKTGTTIRELDEPIKNAEAVTIIKDLERKREAAGKTEQMELF